MRFSQKLSALMVSAAVAAGAVGVNAAALNIVDVYDDTVLEETRIEYKPLSFVDELVSFSISVPDDMTMEILTLESPQEKDGIKECLLFSGESEHMFISSAYHISDGGLSAEMEMWKEMSDVDIFSDVDAQGNTFYYVKLSSLSDCYYIGEYDLGGGAWVNVTVSGDDSIENPDFALDILRSFELSAADFVGEQGDVQELAALGEYIFDAKRVSFEGDKCSFSIDIPAEFAVENTSADVPFTNNVGLANPIFTAENENDVIYAVLVECDGGAKSREQYWKDYTPNTDLDGNNFFCNMTSTSSYTEFHAEYPYDDNSYILLDIIYKSKIDMDTADNIFYTLFSFSKDAFAAKSSKEVAMKRFACESDGLSFSIDVPEEVYSLVENGEYYQNVFAASDGAYSILQANLVTGSYEEEAAKWNGADADYIVSQHTDVDGNEFTLVEIPADNSVLAVYNYGKNMVLVISTELISAETFALMAESFSLSSENAGVPADKGSPDTGVGMISLAVPACAAVVLAVSRKKK